MRHYRRRLPHPSITGEPVFLTWRLHGTLPRARHFPGGALPSGRAFAVMDRLLDAASEGPTDLKRPEIAGLLVESFNYTASVLQHCRIHAYVVMPNHVHLLATPYIELPELTKSLKGYTARMANHLLGRQSQPFWQQETYDHLVRNATEFDRIATYIEQNPVRAGLAPEPSLYRWSSASR